MSCWTNSKEKYQKEETKIMKIKTRIIFDTSPRACLFAETILNIYEVVES